MGKLTGLEQETIILFNEAEKTASVETYNGRLKKKLDKLAAERPEDVTAADGNDGSRKYVVPKKWVTVKSPRIMSDEARARNAERLAKWRDSTRIDSEVE